MSRAEITYKQLLREVRALTKEVTRDAEAVQMEAWALDGAAKDTSRVAEMIAAMEVAPATVSSTLELALAMSGVSNAAGSYAAAAENTARMAAAADAQAQKSHGGIDEAVSRSPEHAGKSGWYREE